MNSCILVVKTYLMKPWTEYVSFPIVSFPTTLFLCHGFVFFSVFLMSTSFFVFVVVPGFDLFPYSISAFFRIQDSDTEDLPFGAKDASIETRRRRLLRICDEAKEQGGLLSQEDLAKLLMSDVRTIRRDISGLKQQGITVPTRGTVKDIGPGVTHKEIAIRLWLEGKEPTEVARRIHHSIKATENYLEKFKRGAYLRREKGFTEFEISRTVGISTAATKTFLAIYDAFKNKALFDLRMEEINIVGKAYHLAEGEKKTFLRRRTLYPAGEADDEREHFSKVRLV